MKTQLKKGTMYATVGPRGVSFGKYIGQLNGYRAFRGSYFACDTGQLSGGLTDEVLNSWIIVEVPKDAQETESKAFAFMESVLPE